MNKQDEIFVKKRSREVQTKDEVVFTLNGKIYKVDGTVPVDTSLNSFIRDYAQLKGTKVMCCEGVCGSCTVNLKYMNKTTNKRVSLAVNSCLMPVMACHGCDITTVEGIGSRKAGYSKIQTVLANFNGTQCGYCSPGFVMSMHSLLDGQSDITVKSIENNFSGNLCRCTGYRPILDAFKSLAINSPVELKRKLLDIEETHMTCSRRSACQAAKENGDQLKCMKECNEDSYELDFVELSMKEESLLVKNDDREWYRASTLKEIFEIMDMIGDKNYILLAGNTARGVQEVPENEPEVYIDVNGAEDLKGYKLTNNALEVGSGINLSELIQILRKAGRNNPGAFGYALQMAEHLTKAANQPVRNRATVGGSLSLVNKMNQFPSDLFLLLDALSATIKIATLSGLKMNVSPTEFLTTDLHKKVISEVSLPAQSGKTILKSYKIMPVNQNGGTIVNGAFLYDLDEKGEVIKKASLVFSGINTKLRHANNTENYISGKNIFNNDILAQAIKLLWNEVQPDDNPRKFSPQYRKILAVAMFYRSIMSLAKDKVKAKYKSGAEEIDRPISSGKQVFQTGTEQYPLNQAIPKIDAHMNTSGEVIYTNDYKIFKQELVGKLILAEKFADISDIDPSNALKMEGVVAFYSAKDIEGTNFMTFNYNTSYIWESELFCSGVVRYWGQPVGIIIAESEDIAQKAKKKVLIQYKEPKTPLLSIQDVLASKETDSRIILDKSQQAKSTGKGTYPFSGEFSVAESGQYAHSIETPSCRVTPEQDGQFSVCVTTQNIFTTRQAIASVTGLPHNKINIIVPHLGGSYGSKNTSQLYAATGCTLAASKLLRPVRMRMSLMDEMSAIGKRSSFYVKYKGEADGYGKIQNLDLEIYIDVGYRTRKPDLIQVLTSVQNYFDTSGWNIKIYDVITDKPPAIIIRGPGFVEPMSIIEQIMDHIAFTCHADPIDVRINNSNDPLINGYINTLRKDTDFDKRKKETELYNKENRWKKRGLSLCAIKYIIAYMGTRLGCTIDILYPDGTIQVMHAGIEMGQGINTKVAQAVAYELTVPLKNIQIKQTSTYNSANATGTLGSYTSELVVYTAIQCCKQLNKDLETVKASLNNPTWTDIVEKAFNMRVPLSVSLPLTQYPDEKNQIYFVCGVCVTETELDILTGRYQIRRVDILEDVGKSINPDIDVGQVEGAFIMGLGLHTMERSLFDKTTGALLTNRLFLYHVPRSLDIPIDFRVTFVPNSTNPVGVLNSKATGEPAAALSVSVVNSFRQGVLSAREDAGMNRSWIQLNSPCTPEIILLASATSIDQFKL